MLFIVINIILTKSTFFNAKSLARYILLKVSVRVVLHWKKERERTDRQLMKRFIFVIPVIVLVFSIATWMLNKDFSMIDAQTRTLIAIGASVFSGIITFFLMRSDIEHITEAHLERQNAKRKK
ncbi:hypothetical protein AWH49_15745 [Domibacillus aminovorans]|uniref:Uncharacterized protein n=2 Tax=Domibacillus aminovorans TaxID=29332 RepID=A0A177L5F4_9BACI|nr:hypothetical protein AWH49_15745 [Domibacillus aminovorans]